MILFAPIVPVKLLPLIQSVSYHMCLAQLVEQSVHYTTFYREAAMTQTKFVILDNGAAEQGQMPFDMWARAIHIIRPQEVVLYDVPKNKSDTIAYTKNSYMYLSENSPILQEIPSLMAVPHGESYHRVLDCARWMIDQEYITTLGISKFLTQQFNDKTVRLKLLDELRDEIMDAGKDVHLLGCHTSFGEILDVKMYHKWIRGWDSALPTLFAKQGWPITVTTERPKQDIEFLLDDDNTVNPALLAGNIDKLLEGSLE